MDAPTTRLIQDRDITFTVMLLHLELALRVGLPAFCTPAEPMQLFISCHDKLELPGPLVVHLKQFCDKTVESAWHNSQIKNHKDTEINPPRFSSACSLVASECSSSSFLVRASKYTICTTSY